MASGKAVCKDKDCPTVIKLEPCGGCPEGYDPIVCPVCGGEIEIEKLPVAESKEVK